jgi:hypothetical protein
MKTTAPVLRVNLVKLTLRVCKALKTDKHDQVMAILKEALEAEIKTQDTQAT